ncbi:MAG TPA: glycosyltransferase family 2 protein [Gemmatimonadales bacterium]|jgi:dolichol-phosphate mannosyltransferase
MRLSITMPLLNEEGIVPELVRRVGAVLDAIPGGPHELLVIDDGSTDDTRALLVDAAATDPRIRCLFLSRNFGHQAAITAGIDHVTGDLIVVMDGDLQDRPEDIPAMLARQAEGYDVVYAIRTLRKEGIVLRACYFLFYRTMARFAKVRVPLDAGDFALMTRRVLDTIRSAPERNRYVRGLRAWAGFRQIGLPVERDSRVAGTSKYSYAALVRLGLDGLFAFSTIPIRAAMFLGLGAVGVACLYAAWAVFQKLVLQHSPQGFTGIIVVVTFLSGVNLFFLGVIGEYVGRVYEEVKARPMYVVERVIGQSH